MNAKTTKLILYGMLAGVLLGGLLGYVWPEALLATEVIGVLFLNALKLIIIPLIVTSMIVGVTSMGDIRKVGRMGMQVIAYFLITTTIAVVIGLVLVNITNPGAGIDPAGAELPEKMVAAQERGISDIFEALIPANLVKAMAEGKFLGIIIFSLVFGGVLTTLGPKAKSLISLFGLLNDVVMKMVFLILYIAPIGLFSVVGTIVARNSDSVGQLGTSLFWYGFTLVIGLIIHAGIVLPAILKFFGHRSPIKYATNMLPAFATAVGTSSSSATLPVTYECVVDKNKVDPRAGQFVLPLGTTVNMDGTAMYVVIATIFIAQVYGLSLGILDMIMIGFTAVLVSIGAAGIPSAALFMLAIVFGVANFPPEAYAGIGLILAVDWLLDRCRTTVNVWGDSVGAAVIGESFEFKTARRQPARPRPVGRSPRGSRTGSTQRPVRTQRSDRGYRSDGTPSRSKPVGARRTRSGPDKSERGETRRTSSRTPVKSEPSPFEITESGGPVFDREGSPSVAAETPQRSPRPTREPRRRAPGTSSRSGRSRSGTDRENTRNDSRNRDAEVKPRNDTVSADAAARDLARLSAQLRTNGSAAPEGSPARPKPPQPEPVSPPSAETPATRNSSSTAQVEAEFDSTSAEFGRPPARKGMAARKAPDSVPADKESSEPSQDAFKTEGQAFGRSRKKRP